MIPFNLAPRIGTELLQMQAALDNDKISGDGPFTRLCQHWFETRLPCLRTLLTSSCTHALEMSALLAAIGKDDEIILPSFTFVSTATAFALRGAKLVFVDIRPDTQNIDETLIDAAVTPRTKAICVVHYAGIPCEMSTILAIAKKHGLLVIEDAAQAMLSTYKGRNAGTLGDLGAYSFHETKNYTSAGEGGLLLANRSDLTERAEIIREKGTNRSQYFRGMVDKYTWVDIGSSYLMNDVSAAFLWAQLQAADEIRNRRLAICAAYTHALTEIAAQGRTSLPVIPPECTGNGHMFYLKLGNIEERTRFITHLAQRGVMAVFHYVPLHSAPAGLVYGRFSGEDRHTTHTSETLVRLPLFYNMTDGDVVKVIDATLDFFAHA